MNKEILYAFELASQVVKEYNDPQRIKNLIDIHLEFTNKGDYLLEANHNLALAYMTAFGY